MKRSLNFKPFGLFWLNCAYSTMFSLLISLEPSYYFAAILNDYSYLVIDEETPTGIKYNHLELWPIVKHYERYRSMLFNDYKPLNFESGDNYFDILKGLIEENKLILLGVDLFYWLPNTISWKRNHWAHYSFINGINDEKRAVYVFERNSYGYDEFEIPEDRLIDSISNFPREPHVMSYKFPENIEKFELSIDEVKGNAQRIIDEINNNIMPVNFWELGEEDFAKGYTRDLTSLRFFQISNRHIANELLIQALGDEILSPEIRSSLIKYCKELQEGWELAKIMFLRLYVSKNRKSDINNTNEKVRSLFSKEIEMWDMFLKHAG
ncbi:MAG: hypothetical protein ACOX4M_04615 [Acetivibrionales bacterium]|jgi:hypothetical protein